MNSVYNNTDENKTVSNSTPSFWVFVGSADTLDKLQKYFELRSQNDNEIHVKK